MIIFFSSSTRLSIFKFSTQKTRRSTFQTCIKKRHFAFPGYYYYSLSLGFDEFLDGRALVLLDHGTLLLVLLPHGLQLLHVLLGQLGEALLRLETVRGQGLELVLLLLDRLLACT